MKIPTFIKFIFHFTIRLFVVFGFIALLIFLLWGALYLIFLQEDQSDLPTHKESVSKEDLKKSPIRVQNQD